MKKYIGTKVIKAEPMTVTEAQDGYAAENNIELED